MRRACRMATEGSLMPRVRVLIDIDLTDDYEDQEIVDVLGVAAEALGEVLDVAVGVTELAEVTS